MIKLNREVDFNDVNQRLRGIIESCLDEGAVKWIEEKLEKIVAEGGSRSLYMTYSMLSTRLDKNKVMDISGNNDAISDFLNKHKATELEIGRIYLLVSVLNINEELFAPFVGNIIQIADKGELEAFLKYLILLPSPENYRTVAVEALRTNISTVFDAIALNNPYPAKYFNDQQWNQMYLKAAFLQRPLNEIMFVDERANKELSRIISDYAHERWAAGRGIDPLIWRPVSKCMDTHILSDIMRLFNSNDVAENRAAALVCYTADMPEAVKLLEENKELLKEIQHSGLSWNTIKD